MLPFMPRPKGSSVTFNVMLSDVDMLKQTRQVMDFLEQEANEKAEETDENHHLVGTQRLRIMGHYEKEEEETVLGESSNVQFDELSKTQALRARDDLISDVLNEANREFTR
ncbi:V-type proton ATPase subunit E 1 [Cricetulus griseus]|uniref:V-type proton ATPase subunit E 1 n=1 Tax=Cricetulus griseus TaxID=10029 RepID=G3H7W6_CRIGR|nr:V-type proton ATPase subunit E 1 [Cricetulus griseus]